MLPVRVSLTVFLALVGIIGQGQPSSGLLAFEPHPQETGGSFPFPPRSFRTVPMPPAKEKYRGLLAEIDARFALHCRNGEVIQVEAVEVRARTPYDPLPEIMELGKDVISWGRHSRREWKTSRIDPFQLEVRIKFRTDSSLEENVVLYRVE